MPPFLKGVKHCECIVISRYNIVLSLERRMAWVPFWFYYSFSMLVGHLPAEHCQLDFLGVGIGGHHSCWCRSHVRFEVRVSCRLDHV